MGGDAAAAAATVLIVEMELAAFVVSMFEVADDDDCAVEMDEVAATAVVAA